jgi:large subunit ribosomal protein L23
MKFTEEQQELIEVSPTASKSQIRAAIEARFKVTVLSVRTIKVLGKYRRKVGPIGGYQPNRKKAIVNVKAGQQINWEEVA